MTILKKGSKGDEVKTLQKSLYLVEDGIFGPLTEEAVKEFQKEHGLTPDGVVGAKTWNKLGISDTKSTVKKSTRSINKFIIHCTATVEGQNITVADVKRWHKMRGFSDIGYHYLIYLDGSIHNGRDVNISGAHTLGYNSHSIGICYVGGLDKNKKAKDTRTPEQKASLLKLLKQLKSLYPKATIHGHYEFANKACPCFKPKEEYKNL